MSERRVRAVIEKRDDHYVARCPTTGTTARGSTPAQAVARLEAAVAEHLEMQRLVELVEFV